MILVKVMGKPHHRKDKDGNLVAVPVGSVIEATEAEVKAFKGRLVPVAGMVPQTSPGE